MFGKCNFSVFAISCIETYRISIHTRRTTLLFILVLIHCILGMHLNGKNYVVSQVINEGHILGMHLPFSLLDVHLFPFPLVSLYVPMIFEGMCFETDS